MARQSTAPVQFNRSIRTDEGVLMSSGRAGLVIPVGYAPVLRGDSVAGRISVDLNLAEMPRPLLNAVFANVQAWFVPKSIHPQFAGMDEFYASYAGEPIKTVGQPDRAPPAFFHYNSSFNTFFPTSPFAQTLGIHTVSGDTLNTDLVDAFVAIYNFRLAAHSSKLARKDYTAENVANACALPPAFWPSGRFARIVPDYEEDLVVGALDLDISAGRVPIRNLLRSSGTPADSGYFKVNEFPLQEVTPTTPRNILMDTSVEGGTVFADLAAQMITSSLADIDKARALQSFAKLRTAMAGNNGTGFVSDETILAHLMQGLSVPEDLYKRPWLLNSKRVPFGFAERFSTEGATLDQSVTTGRSSAELSINIPRSEVGGTIVVTVEVLPERLDERQEDNWLTITQVDKLPNALRDVLNPEPVDLVPNSRIDVKHTQPSALYGFEPMNDKWNRSFTRLGGAFFQENPGVPAVDQRMAIWQAMVTDPVYSQDHFLAPQPFPHYVFSDTAAPAFEFVTRHSLKIVGNTQIGDMLSENNNEFADTEAVKNEV